MTIPDWLTSGWPHIWLPYAQMQTAALPLAVVDAEGCELILADGRRLIDGIASWWSACHGYKHPHIIENVKRQLETLPHVMFGGLAHEPAYTLAARLSAKAPPGLSRVFYSDSGSTAVEVALKMALQYWRGKGRQGKNRFLCFEDGYHGDTLGAMAVSDPERSMHKAFRHSVTHQYVVPLPRDEYGFAEFANLLEGVADQLAGIIIEPLVQGAGGMRFHEPDVLAEIRRLAERHGVLFIADEVMTGFCRTGNFFACNEAGISPDIMCIGKALTGGTLPFAATLASEEVFASFLSDKPEDAFMHGPTYMANPLGCAAALASLDLFEREPRLKQVEAIETQLRTELEPCRPIPGVVDVRVKGAIGVVQLRPECMDISAFRTRFLAEGVWIRPFKDILYVAPPFTITQTQLSTLTRAIRHCVEGL